MNITCNHCGEVVMTVHGALTIDQLNAYKRASSCSSNFNCLTGEDRTPPPIDWGPPPPPPEPPPEEP